MQFVNWLLELLGLRETKRLFNQQDLPIVIKDTGEVVPIFTTPTPAVDVLPVMAPLSPIQLREHLFNTMVVHKHIKDANGKILVANIDKVIEAKAKQIIKNKKRYQG